MFNDLHWQKLIIRYIRGECSEAESIQVQNWITKSPENKQEYEAFLETWKKTGDLNLQTDDEHSWNRILKSISESEQKSVPIYKINPNAGVKSRQPDHRSSYKRRASNFRWILRIAAILLITAGASYLIFESQIEAVTNSSSISDTRKPMREIVTKAGEKASVTFSDGTEVIVNSNSVLRFPEKFVTNRREVELLEGEAFFSVVNKGNIPFLVHTNYADVKVLGTKFNVNAHSKNEHLEVVVAEGKVAVRSNRNESDYPDSDVKNREVVLTKGEFAKVDLSSFPTAPQKVRLKSYLGWVNGLLVFDKDPLKEVLFQLSNYYDVEFDVSDAQLYDRHLTAVFNRESLSKVLKIVALSADMSYYEKDGKIIFRPN